MRRRRSGELSHFQWDGGCADRDGDVAIETCGSTSVAAFVARGQRDLIAAGCTFRGQCVQQLGGPGDVVFRHAPCAVPEHFGDRVILAHRVRNRDRVLVHIIREMARFKDAVGGNELLYELVGFRLVGVVVGIGVTDTLEQLHTQLGDRGRPRRTFASNGDVSIVRQGSGGYPIRVAFEDATRTAVIDPFQDFAL